MSAEDVWRFAAAHLGEGHRVVLLVLAESTGETPGKPGFKMAAARNGTLCGTIGGGALEHDAVEEAREMLRAGVAAPRLREVTMNPGLDPASAMICGGIATVVLYPLAPADLPAVNRLAAAAAAGERGRLVIGPDGFACERGAAAGPAHAFREAEGRSWRYEEKLGAGDTVYLAGGGHVALALSRVLATLDFRVQVFDERPEVSTVKANRYADRITIAPFAAVGARIPDGDETYVVIMTPGHRADELVLRQLVARPLRFLGMMGSRRKAAEILNRLRNDGVAEEALKRVRTPVGLPIKSHTAEEIAISIAAELILERNGRPDA